MKFLITGATGDVGARVARFLLERGERPRVFVRNEEKARSLFGSRVDFAAGDLGDAASLKAALQGVDALFLVNSGPAIPERDAMAANMAREAGVARLVKLSSLDVEQGLAIGAWHEKGEAAVQRSGVPYTFVRPTGFMSNLLAWRYSVRNEGMVRSSAGSGQRAFIHSDDIAAVSVEALLKPGYEGEALAITGPEASTFGEVTEKLGVALGRNLRFEAVTDDEARQRYAAATRDSAEEVEAHVNLWRAIREGRLGKVTGEVKRVLGRKPTSLDAWISENVEAFR